MTPRIFAYVLHRSGALDDSAMELAAAAKKINPAGPMTAIVTGFGESLETACTALRQTYAEVWKIANESLLYPNAELVRQAMVQVVPRGSIVLVAHDHFGIDLSPGLSVKLNASFISDALDLKPMGGTTLGAVRQEFGGQVSTHVQCDISAGAVINVRPGAFKALQTAAIDGKVVDKSAEVGALTSGRRYCETVVAEPGDVYITKHAILVSVGRGIQEPDYISLA
jgi:electron transfer flavoprotein alpha subunit